jgi:isopentenyl-diphosphate delta-isomerase
VRRAVGPGVTLVAAGGVRSGLDVAKALALGADLGGMALPLFRAQQEGGLEGLRTALQTVITTLRSALLLTGSRTPAELRARPFVVTGELKDWLASLSSMVVHAERAHG